MKLQKLNILGKTFQLKSVTPADLDLYNPASIGATRYNDCLIKYLETLKGDELRDTLLHESIHVIDYTAQLGLEEKQVHALASLLLSVLKDNKEFSRWLIK
jgi:hypothetical protein